MQSLVAFLRGINVGGHHKVPMADLRSQLAAMGCLHIKTVLNSGNVLFDIGENAIQQLEQNIESYISNAFGFPIPVVLRTKQSLADLIASIPYEELIIQPNKKLYVTFVKDDPNMELILPYFSEDRTMQIVAFEHRTVVSVLDLSQTDTPKGMEELEKLFGKQITTRNWNTILKILGK